MIAYVDTSAAAKLIVDEVESPVLADELDRLAAGGARIMSSGLLETELRRLAIRLDLDQQLVTEVLDRVDLVATDMTTLRGAGLLPGRGLRSLDAIHVATALRMNADVVVSYDARQVLAARAAGLRVSAPGTP